MSKGLSFKEVLGYFRKEGMLDGTRYLTTSENYESIVVISGKGLKKATTCIYPADFNSESDSYCVRVIKRDCRSGDSVTLYLETAITGLNELAWAYRRGKRVADEQAGR